LLSGLTDEQLISMADAGDVQAYGELVLRYQAMVIGFLTRLTAQRSLAQDLAQESFVKGFLKLGQFSRSGTFKSWIFTIAYREFLTASRRARQSFIREQIVAADTVTSIEEDNSMSLDMERALQFITRNERETLVLFYSAGFTHAEISELSGLPLGTVKSHILRGREKLKIALGFGDQHD
jgi:RNA polymerase sigma-70 factor, ECF subfamily